MRQFINPQRFFDRLAGVLLCIVMLVFFYIHLKTFFEELRPSLLLISIFEFIVAVFALTRRQPISTTDDWKAWVAATIGTYGIFLARPPEGGEDLLVGQLVQLAGLTMQIASLSCLNRSFGIVPANRGIKISGAYGIVRHPLYTSYIISYAGYLINNMSLLNALIIAATIPFQIARIYFEEIELGKDGEYRAYQNIVRFRLIPFVW